jgi:Protein of function (DUF2518)
MEITIDFLDAAKWAGILTLVCAVVTLLGFILKWGIRFRLVGATSFMGVLTAGLFALSLGLFPRAAIPGAVRYSLVYDNGAAQVAIALPPQITESELDATLRQAAVDLFSYGRLGQTGNQMTIRARTILHPEPGLSQLLELGQVKRSLASRENEELAIEIYSDKLAKLPKPTA